jgi:hypothetical protein
MTRDYVKLAAALKANKPDANADYGKRDQWDADVRAIIRTLGEENSCFDAIEFGNSCGCGVTLDKPKTTPFFGLLLSMQDASVGQSASRRNGA